MCAEAVNAINADRLTNGETELTPWTNSNGERAMSYTSSECRCCNIYLHKNAGGTGYFYTAEQRESGFASADSSLRLVFTLSEPLKEGTFTQNDIRAKSLIHFDSNIHAHCDVRSVRVRQELSPLTIM